MGSPSTDSHLVVIVTVSHLSTYHAYPYTRKVRFVYKTNYDKEYNALVYSLHW